MLWQKFKRKDSPFNYLPSKRRSLPWLSVPSPKFTPQGTSEEAEVGGGGAGQTEEGGTWSIRSREFSKSFSRGPNDMTSRREMLLHDASNLRRMWHEGGRIAPSMVRIGCSDD